MLNFPLLSLALAAALLSSCATTRVVQTQPQKGGVIAVKEGLIGDARKDAKAKMKSNCPKGRYQILEEGVATVGSKSRGTADKQKVRHGLTLTSTESETHDVTEWRIKYRCSR